MSSGGPLVAECRVERIGAQVELDVQGRQERVDPVARSARGRAGIDHEVTVRTEGDAEGDVDVQRAAGADRMPAAASLTGRATRIPGRR